MNISLSADTFKPCSSSSETTEHGEWNACRVTSQLVPGPVRGSPWHRSQGLGHSTGWVRRRRPPAGRTLKFTLSLQPPSWAITVTWVCLGGPWAHGGDLAKTAHLKLSLSRGFYNSGYSNVSLSDKNEENLVEVYSQFALSLAFINPLL